MLGGFETVTPPLETFEWNDDRTPRSYGTYTGSTMMLVLAVDGDPAPFRATLPGAGETSVLYASPAKLNSIDTTFMMRGRVDVTAVSIAGGLASATGTFAGTLVPMMGGGRAIEITDGRFEASGMPDLATIAPR
jgi:hypothetical protein